VVDRPPEIPDAPSAPQRPWAVLLTAGAVGGGALLLLLWLAKDDATDAASFLDPAIHPERVQIGYKT